MGIIKKVGGAIGKYKSQLASGTAGAALGFAAGRYSKKLFGGGRRRGRGTGRLKSQVMRLSLKIKKKQLERKLFKEELRV